MPASYVCFQGSTQTVAGASVVLPDIDYYYNTATCTSAPIIITCT